MQTSTNTSGNCLAFGSRYCMRIELLYARINEPGILCLVLPIDEMAQLERKQQMENWFKSEDKNTNGNGTQRND